MDPEALAIDFVRALERKDFDAATEHFHPKTLAMLTPFMLEEAWARAMRTVGNFIDIAGTRPACHLFASNIRVVFVSCKFARATVNVELGFNEVDQIIGLAFLREGFVD